MKRVISLSRRTLGNVINARFGSHGGDITTNPHIRFPKEGEIHQYPPVEIDWNKKWVANTSSLGSGLNPLFGLVDINDTKVHDHSDPFAHLRGKPFWTFEQLAFTDPYYHSDKDEPLMNTPHGYVITSDPLDERNLGYVNFLEYVMAFFVMVLFAVLYGRKEFSDINQNNQVYMSYSTAFSIEEELRKIRIDNQKLENRLEELKSEFEALE